MGKSGPKQPVTDYTMSVHYGISLGVVVLKKIFTGEKLAWRGRQEVQGDIYIDNTELYGGAKKEGGVQGVAHFLPGGPAQVIPEHIAERYGLTSATMPAYRGVSSIFFYGGQKALENAVTPPKQWQIILNGKITSRNALSRGGATPNGVNAAAGFYWQSNNPTLKTIWTQIERIPTSLGISNSAILNQDTVTEFEDSNSGVDQDYDANPAHMIFDCLTNTDFGMGASTEMIEVDSFTDAAETLFEEDFGMSMLWTQQTTIEKFIAEILDHIQAVLYVSPKTGLLTLKLLRDDYVASAAPLFTPDNCTLVNFGRKGEGETINEMTITYTNWRNEEEATITQQNNAGIAAVGDIVPDSRNYYGIRKVSLASMVLNRDLRASTLPLAKCSIIANRDAWDRAPGDVIRVTYPEHGLAEVVFRVGAIDYGKSKDQYIRADITEDVFSYDPGSYTIPNETAWQDTSQVPEPLTYTQITTLPYYFARAIDTLPEGDAFVAALGGTTQTDAFGFDLLIEAVLSDGSLEYELSGLKAISGHAELAVALEQEETSEIDFDNLLATTVNAFPLEGGFLLIGTADEETHEWAYIRAADSNSAGVWLIDRGMMDTTPKAWADGSAVWFVDTTAVFYDNTPLAAGADFSFKMLTRTSLGRLREDDATPISHVISERPMLPLRPADVRVNGTQWDDPDDPLDLDLDSNSATTPLEITWANRNRDTEENTLLRWTDASVTPPTAVLTRVSVWNIERDTMWFEFFTVTGATSYTLDPAEFVEPVGVIRVTAWDDDANSESLQGHEITVRVRSGGFGFDFGENFGGL